MADDSVIVQFGAEIADFTAGVNQVKEQFAGLTAPITQLAESFGGLGEIAGLALASAKELVDAMTGAANSAAKFGIQILQVKTAMGSSSEQAAALAEGMALLGSNSDLYTSASAKLDQQIKSNESAVNALGVATRDQSRNLLSSQQQMQNAVAALEGYKEGADRNAASLYLFGRSAAEMTPVLLLNNEVLQQASDLMKEIGVDTTMGAVNAADEYTRASSKLGESFRLMGVKIGQELEPSLTVLYQSIQSVAIPIFNALNTILEAVIATLDAFFTSLADGFRMIRLAVEELNDLAHLDFKGMKAHFDAEMGEMFESGKAFADRMSALFSGIGTNQKPLIGAGSKSFHDPAQTQKDADLQKKIDDDNARAFKESLDQETRDLVDANNERIKTAKSTADEQAALYKALYQAGKISLADETQDLINNENDRYAAQLAALQATRNLYQEGEEAYNKAQAAINRAGEEHGKALIEINRQAAQQTKQEWQSIVGPIESSFGTAITGMITKTETWQQTVLRIGNSLLSEMVSKIFKSIVDNWILTESTMTAFTEVQNAVRQALGLSTAVAGKTIDVSASYGKIADAAAVAAANAFASTAAIPYIGPELAPEAATAAYSATMGWAAGLGGGASAEGGMWAVPADNFMVMAHQNESVLPANVAGPMRDFFSGEGGSSGNPVAITFNVSAIDGQSVANLFKNNSATITQVIAAAMRNGNTNLSAALKRA